MLRPDPIDDPSLKNLKKFFIRFVSAHRIRPFSFEKANITKGLVRTVNRVWLSGCLSETAEFDSHLSISQLATKVAAWE